MTGKTLQPTLRPMMNVHLSIYPTMRAGRVWQTSLDRLKTNTYILGPRYEWRSIHEHFVGFHLVHDTTGKGLCVIFPTVEASHMTIGALCRIKGRMNVAPNWRINADVDAGDLQVDIRSVPQHTSHHNLRCYATYKNILEIYPNLCVALHLPLTLPVTVASGERRYTSGQPWHKRDCLHLLVSPLSMRSENLWIWSQSWQSLLKPRCARSDLNFLTYLHQPCTK